MNLRHDMLRFQPAVSSISTSASEAQLKNLTRLSMPDKGALRSRASRRNGAAVIVSQAAAEEPEEEAEQEFSLFA